MLVKKEQLLVANRSSKWIGPVCWGFKDGCKMNLRESMENLGFA